MSVEAPRSISPVTANPLSCEGEGAGTRSGAKRPGEWTRAATDILCRSRNDSSEGLFDFRDQIGGNFFLLPVPGEGCAMAHNPVIGIELRASFYCKTADF